jgi:hypothetical protein
MTEYDVLAQLAADFQPADISGIERKSVPCRECRTKPARNPGCHGCIEADGDCCYCSECGSKRTILLMAGLIELRIAGTDEEAALCFTTVNSLSWCDLAYLTGALLATAAEGIVATEKRGGMTAQEWLSSVRESFSPPH